VGVCFMDSTVKGLWMCALWTAMWEACGCVLYGQHCERLVDVCFMDSTVRGLWMCALWTAQWEACGYVLYWQHCERLVDVCFMDSTVRGLWICALWTALWEACVCALWTALSLSHNLNHYSHTLLQLTVIARTVQQFTAIIIVCRIYCL
jgi:hypothetical protein